MKHTISPYEKQNNPPTDRNDPVGAATAVEIRFPETFSDRAWKVIDYFDGTICLYIYKGKFVATDESLELTEYGDGSAVAPYGGPRWTGDSLEELEKWLEAVADDYDKFGDMEGWEVEKGKASDPIPPEKPESSKTPKASKQWVVAEVYKGTVPSLYWSKKARIVSWYSALRTGRRLLSISTNNHDIFAGHNNCPAIFAFGANI